jgi:hypothetical protein
MIATLKDTRGMALVLCLLIMTVAALIGIGIATSSTIDGQISRNQRNFTKSFFIADGTNRYKQAKILTDDNLAPTILDNPEVVWGIPDDPNNPTKWEPVPENLPDTQNLPAAPMFLTKIDYLFRRHITFKNSIENQGHFKYYYYSIETGARRNNRRETAVKTTEKKLGI